MRVLIVGQAKSGTTALLYAVVRALGDPVVAVEERIASFGVLAADVVAKIIFEHERPEALSSFGRSFDRRILLVRDPRDLLISCLTYVVASQRERLADTGFLTRFVDALKRKQQDPRDVHLRSLFALFGTPTTSIVDDVLEVGNRLAAFLETRGNDWFVLRYESFVGNDLDGLSAYVGTTIGRDVVVDPLYARVARTKAAGDWRHWFTPADVVHLKPVLQPLMTRLGYGTDWDLPALPKVTADHSWRYVLRLIEERRRFYGLPAAGTPIEQDACTICGGLRFGLGPGGRTAPNGSPPACLSCGSLERQRMASALVERLPPGFLSKRRGLAIGALAWLPAGRLASLSRGAVDADGTLALPDGGDGRYDVIGLDHALEYVRDDKAAFERLAQGLSGRGLMMVLFAPAPGLTASQDFDAPVGVHRLWHRYADDVGSRFRCADWGLSVLVAAVTDPSTGLEGRLHLFVRNDADDALCRAVLDARDIPGPAPAA